MLQITRTTIQQAHYLSHQSPKVTRVFAVLALFSFLVFANCISTNSQKEDPTVAWGREKLISAMEQIGFAKITAARMVHVSIDPTSSGLPDTARKSEGYAINVKNGKAQVWGYDSAGALYGCLELARRIQEQRKLPDDLNFSDAPAMKLRGTCIFFMKVGTYNYPVTPKDFPFFYDKDLWIKYLDFLAEHRYNYIAFWNGHPFAYFVKLAKYPEAQDGMEPGLIEQNHDMLAWLCRESSKRNIRFMFEFYNIHTSVYFQRAHGLDDELHSPTPLLADYTAYCIERFVSEFPDVGLYITPGEALDIEHTTDWLGNVIFPAVERTGQRPPIFVRAWGDGIDLKRAKEIAMLYPNLYFERKFNVEMIADTRVDPENVQWAKLTGNFVLNIHCMANLEPLRWTPPFYIQKCLQSSIAAGANSLHLYPRKAWRWPYGCDLGPAELQWHRDALWFGIWGRYAWNPDRDLESERQYWIRELKNRYGTKDTAEHFLKAFETGADVLPGIQRLLWLGNDNHTVVAAGATLLQIQMAKGIPFLHMDDVVRIPKYLDALRKGERVEGTAPDAFLAAKVNEAKKALAEAEAGAKFATKNQDEAQRIVTDARAVVLITRFYYHKLKAVMAKTLADSDQNPGRNVSQTLTNLKASIADFRELTELTSSTYESLSDVPAYHPVRLPMCPYHWSDVLPIFEKELQVYEEDFAAQKDPAFFEPTLPGLAGIQYGSCNLVDAQGPAPIPTVELDWSNRTADQGRHWSFEWFGYLKAPETGTITFHCASDQGAKLSVNNKTLVEWSGSKGEKSGNIELVKDKMYPLHVIYNHEKGIGGNLKVELSWKGHEKSPISAEFLWHSPAQQRRVERSYSLSFD